MQSDVPTLMLSERLIMLSKACVVRDEWPVMASERRAEDAVDPENTYVKDQNAGVDPMLAFGTITVAGLRDILADLPDEAVVVVAAQGAGAERCSPLADVEEAWYFPVTGDSAPLGRDADGNVHEPGGRDLYAVVLRPAEQRWR